ncbi:MAG: DNA alkylation repair protein [Prevotellaceae bacterium]|nr:DNA alkylation repair protein [Prevotellaceae bacterium]
MNGVAATSMREKGLRYAQNFGVELPRLKAIAAEWQPNVDLAQALWHEEIRECKILAGLLYPPDAFLPDLAEIWVGEIRNIEIAEMTCLHLFRHLSYAPALAFRWISDEREYVQVCGFLLIARLLTERGAMNERASSEFLDQAVFAFLSGTYHIRRAVSTAIRRYMQYSEENAFQVCRQVDRLADSDVEAEQLLYQIVREEVE